MRSLACLAFIIGAAALFAGCGASPPPFGGAFNPRSSTSNARIKSRPAGGLLYAEGASQTYMYSLPGGQLAGKIAVGGNGACTDNNGDIVFTTAGSSNGQTVNYEYSSGGAKLLGTLVDPGDWVSLMCSIDPTTGRVAITSWADASPSGGYNVEVFKNRKSNPKVYWGPKNTAIISCGYDDKGNLFVGALGPNNYGFELLELTNGGDSLVSIPLDKSFGEVNPGTIQWDGQYVAIDLPQKHAIYRVSVAYGVGTVVGSTQLTSGGRDTWLENGMVAAAHGRDAHKLALWHYPQGGRPFKLITSPFRRGLCAVVIGVQ